MPELYHHRRTVPELYEAAIGAEAWAQLAPVIRALHSEGEVAGTLRVRRGSSLWARLLGWLLRLPPAGDAVPVRLTIRREGERLEWTRWFGPHRMRTWQRVGDGLVHELYGPFVVAFRPTDNGAGLDHVQEYAALRLGAWHLRLPRFVAPRVTGGTRLRDDGATVAVEIAFPGGLPGGAFPWGRPAQPA